MDKLSVQFALNNSLHPMLLTRNQVAKTLQVSPRTVDRMKERGALVVETVNGKPLFRANIVAEILMEKGHYPDSIQDIMSKLQAEALTEQE